MKNRRSFLVALLTGAAGAWVTISGSSLLGLVGVGCDDSSNQQPAKYGGNPMPYQDSGTGTDSGSDANTGAVDAGNDADTADAADVADTADAGNDADMADAGDAADGADGDG